MTNNRSFKDILNDLIVAAERRAHAECRGRDREALDWDSDVDDHKDRLIRMYEEAKDAG